MNFRHALICGISAATGLLINATVVLPTPRQGTVILRPKATNDVIQPLYDRLQELQDDRQAALEAATADDNRAADIDARAASADRSSAADASQAARSSAADNRRRAARDDEEMHALLMQIASLQGKSEMEQPNDVPASKPPKPRKPEKPPDAEFGPDPQAGDWTLDLSKSQLQDDGPISETQDRNR